MMAMHKYLIIIGLLASIGLTGCDIIALTFFNSKKQEEAANIGLAEIQLKNFKSNCEAYRLYYKKYPSSFDDLVNTPDNQALLDEVSVDPWGNPYHFEKTDNRIKLYSSGPDAMPNTEDDIVENYLIQL